MDENKELEWTVEQINHPGEYHPIGSLFGGEVQLWVVSAEAGGFDPNGPCRVSVKSRNGGKDHGIINNWQVFEGATAAKGAAQQYVDDNWDDLCALREGGES